MKLLNTISLLAFYLAATSCVFAEEPICHHCEDIREYNAKYHENFEYYDDYLKSQHDSKISEKPTRKK